MNAPNEPAAPASHRAPTRGEVAAYAGLALLAMAPALLHPGSIVGDGVDAYGSHWFYWWMRTCVEHLQSPAWTNLFFYPSGKDVFAHTGLNLLDALLSVPFQWVFGPTLYQPIFMVVLLVGNALTMRALAWDVFGERRAAVVTALLWMTNPYVCYELTEGRPTQAFLWFVPPAFLCLRRAARQPGWMNAVGLGLAVGLAGWTYWFNGFFLVLLMTPLALFELRDAPDRRGALLRWGGGALVAAALVLPAVAAMAVAARHGAVPGVTNSGGIFDAPAGIGEGGLTPYRGLYLVERQGAPQLLQPAWGIPLLLALLARRSPVPRARWIAVLAAGLTIGIGPVLIDGVKPVLWTPYMVLYRLLPFFNRLWFPYRVLGVAFVPVCLLIAGWSQRARWLAPLIVVGSLAGQAYMAVWPLGRHDAASPPMLTALKHEGGALIFLPFKAQHDGLMWQTEFELPTFGGMGETAPTFWPADMRERLNNNFFRALRGAIMVPPQPVPYTPAERGALEAYGFRWVAVRIHLLDQEVDRIARRRRVPSDIPGARREAVRLASEVIGSPPAGLDADVVLWDLKGTYTADAAYAYSDARLQAIPPWIGALSAFEARMQTLGRMSAPAMQDHNLREAPANGAKPANTIRPANGAPPPNGPAPAAPDRR